MQLIQIPIQIKLPYVYEDSDDLDNCDSQPIVPNVATPPHNAVGKTCQDACDHTGKPGPNQSSWPDVDPIDHAGRGEHVEECAYQT